MKFEAINSGSSFSAFWPHEGSSSPSKVGALLLLMLKVTVTFSLATFPMSLVSVPFTSSSQLPHILERDLCFWIFCSSLILSVRKSTKALSPSVLSVLQPQVLQSHRPGRGLEQLLELRCWPESAEPRAWGTEGSGGSVAYMAADTCKC